MKIAVAMSGGVDSSVAAAFLKEQGHDVIGVTMQLWRPHTNSTGKSNDERSCCIQDTIENARKVAYRLGIPHHIIDFRDSFARLIIDDFCREYRLGKTPNPCVRCNRYMKFGLLQEKAAQLNADYIATGHHVRIERETTGTYRLKKGKDPQKDQSYFLCQVTREQLEKALFPIGDLTKKEVREIAEKLDLPVADQPDSQEICFIPDNDHAAFIEEYIPQSGSPGPILDKQGHLLGQHHGIISYTVGQRRGLGIAAAEPLYVTDIKSETNTVVVSTKRDIYGRELIANEMNWINKNKSEYPFTTKGKIRYHHPEAEAIVTPLKNGNVYVKFIEPQMAITPGQTIAFYEGDIVLGGGTIYKRGR